jgi:hypothetical protein
MVRSMNETVIAEFRAAIERCREDSKRFDGMLLQNVILMDCTALSIICDMVEHGSTESARLWALDLDDGAKSRIPESMKKILFD